ncbi:hypothetical protein Hte_009145 [Hypoxylon texense]
MVETSERLRRCVRYSIGESSGRLQTEEEEEEDEESSTSRHDHTHTRVVGNRAGRLDEIHARRATRPSYDAIRINAGGQRDAAAADVEAQLQNGRQARRQQELQRQWHRDRWRRRFKKFLLEHLGPCFSERAATAVSDFFAAPMDRDQRTRCILWYILFSLVVAALVGVCVAYSKGVIRGPP